MSEKIVTKYFKHCTTAEPIKLAFSSSYMVEFEFSDVYSLLSREAIRTEYGDL